MVYIDYIEEFFNSSLNMVMLVKLVIFREVLDWLEIID